MGIQFLTILAMGAGFLLQSILKSKMGKYSQVTNDLGLTGKEVAEKMLSDHGIIDVKVISTGGQLTDHYNPTDKTVNLSEVVYSANTVTAAAISAHEVGHAVQHATAYSMLGLRSRLVPFISFSNQWMPYVIMGGFALLQITPLPLMLGILLYGFTALFAIVTLPVEFDASKRGLAWLESKGMQGENYDMAKDGLKWAAMTYILSAVSSVLNLLYYLRILNSNRR